MGFDLHSDLHTPFYLGGGTSSLTPFIADAAIGGHSYMIDWKAELPLVFRSVPLLRNQADDSELPGEHSINPEGWWRRSGESWHFGAGQDQFDRKDSNPYRFRTSRGMDVWTKWHLSLLPDTDAKAVSAATNQKVIVAGAYLYYTDGTVLRRTQDITVDTPTFTTITGTPGTAPTDITTDGFNIITCHGAAGIYKTTRGAAAVGGAAHITGTVTKLGFVKNRFLAANANSLYDITALTVGAGGALPAAFYTHPNTDFTWVGFAEGDAAIYAAGFSGDKSIIYRTAVKQDGTALDSPVVAGRLPEGEIVSSIYGYLGRFIVIGTNQGFRFALTKDSGDLSIGKLVPTTLAVQCFEGQGPHIWFGWGNFDSTHTGLGRMSIEFITDTELLVPAYASDLMVSGQTANVSSVVTFQNLRVFTVNGIGMWAQHATNLVADGYLDTGEISYNMTEKKIGISIDAQHMGEEGMHEILISADGGPFVSLGIHEAHLFPRDLGTSEAAFFEFRHVLYRDAGDATAGLSIHSWLLLVQPLSNPTENIYMTIILAPQVEDNDDGWLTYDTLEEMDFLSALAVTKEITTCQALDRLYSVVVDDYELPVQRVQRGIEGMSGFNGSILLKMKRVS